MKLACNFLALLQCLKIDITLATFQSPSKQTGLSDKWRILAVSHGFLKNLVSSGLGDLLIFYLSVSHGTPSRITLV